MAKSNLIQITGLWLNKTKDGKKYFAGYMGNARVLIFKNEYKKEDSHPDYNLLIGPKPEKDQDADDAEDGGDDELPF